MSTPAKSKSRDKKVVNDSHKTPPTKVASASTGGGSIGGAYNPLLGTVESLNGSSLHHTNGRFRSIDESDSTGADCDSVSNNGSWSGDSEDHKEKAPPTPTTTAKQEATVPGADNEKREKMRLKNERKHQRQKEKRAQELHERCCQFLMSRKLEVLAEQIEQIIHMENAPHERVTHALMLNQGKLEESINWLLDESGANVEDDTKLPTSGNLKIDISQELGRILELETKYKCTKQDVERAVVTAEGDIERAEESLRRQKQDQASIKAEDVISDNGKAPSVQLQPSSGGESLGYSRGSGYISGESGNQSVNPLDKINMNLQLMKTQQNAAMEEKKRMVSQQTPLSRPIEETHNHVAALSDQVKRQQQQEMREPVMVMQQQQRSQAVNTNVLPLSTMNPSFTVAAAIGGGNGWYPATSQSNGYLPTRTLPPSDLNSNLMYHQLQYQQYQGQVSNGNRMAVGSAPHYVAPAASLGLFSGYGSASSSGIDWNDDGSKGKFDYNKIDWSLDRGLACPRQDQEQCVAAASPYEADMTRMNGNVNGMGMAMGVQEAALVGNGREWTSPFEGKDLFGLSRQYVPPSL